MQAFEIAYDRSETRLVLGWPSGLVRIHEVAEDGGPGAQLAEVRHHRARIVHASFVGDQVVTVCESGRWALSDAATGAVLRSGAIEGESASASVDPTGATLALYVYAGEARVFAVDLATGATRAGPPVERLLGLTSRAFALDPHRAAFHVCRKVRKVVQDGLVTVDFAAGTAELRTFASAPARPYDDERMVLALDPVAGHGIRRRYAPFPRRSVDGRDCLAVELEVFAIDDLAVRSVVPALYFPEAQLEPAVRAKLASGDTAARDTLVDSITALQVRGDVAWIGVIGGRVRRLDLKTGVPSPLVAHGGEPPRGGYTLDDVFARNLVNNFTLGVSPGGRKVGFGNPNEFFDADVIGLDTATAPIALPPRYTGASDALELAQFCGLTADGAHLVVTAASDDLFVVDAETGAVVARHRIDFPYGDVTGAAKSPDGRWLVLSMSGGSPILWDLESGEAGFVEVPPHTGAPAFVGERLVVLGHHDGAAVGVDLEAFLAAAAPEDEGDEEEADGFEVLAPGAFAMREVDGEPCDDEWQVFEQGLSDWVSFAVGEVGGEPVVATCDDGGSVALFAVGSDGFRALGTGASFEPTYRGLHGIAFAGSALVGPVGADRLAAVDPVTGEAVATFAHGGLTRLLPTPSGLLGFGGNAWVRVDPTAEAPITPLFTVPGAAVGAASAGGDRVAWAEADGAIVLADRTGAVTLRVGLRPGAQERTLVVLATD